jgi:hypothetical protein
MIAATMLGAAVLAGVAGLGVLGLVIGSRPGSRLMDDVSADQARRIEDERIARDQSW